MPTPRQTSARHNRRRGPAREIASGRGSSGRTLRLTDSAYAAVKQDIIECVLVPGSEVTEPELGSRYGFGKAPLREALIRLVHESLIEAIPRSGYRISPVTIQDVHDIFDLRLLLEPTAARRAAGHIEAPLLTSLNELCRSGYTPGDRATESAFLRANRQFHVAIAAASGNGRLARVIERLLEETERLFHLGLAVRDRTDEMQHEHEELLRALVDGDPDAAERITVEQVTAARTMVMDGILAAPWLKRTPISGW